MKCFSALHAAPGIVHVFRRVAPNMYFQCPAPVIFCMYSVARSAGKCVTCIHGRAAPQIYHMLFPARSAGGSHVFPARSAGKRQARAFCGEAAPPARNEAAENAESATFAPLRSLGLRPRSAELRSLRTSRVFRCRIPLRDGAASPQKARAWREGLLPRCKQSRPL